MNGLNPSQLLSPAEYLARELDSTVKHEYVGGMVHAMSGARTRHNRIATSVMGALRQSLKGHKCEAFNSDMKVRIQLRNSRPLLLPRRHGGLPAQRR